MTQLHVEVYVVGPVQPSPVPDTNLPLYLLNEWIYSTVDAAEFASVLNASTAQPALAHNLWARANVMSW
jgi:hypothetical protein